MIELALFVRQARLQALADAIDSGSAAGVLELYSAVGTMLAGITLSKPCGTVGVDGDYAVLTLGPVSNNTVIADGTAANCAIRNSDGAYVLTGDVGVTNSGALVELPANAINLYTGGSVTIGLVRRFRE